MPAKKINNNLVRPLIMIIILAVIITGWLIYDHNKSTTLKTSTYTSAKYNYTIAFPGTPKSTSTTKTVDHISAKTTYTSSTVNNGTQHFEVYASDLPQITEYNALPTKQKSIALTAGADSAITVLLSATSINSTDTSFLGHPAVDVTFRTSSKGTNINGYGRAFVLGTSEYLILSTGASKSNFTDFANSFKYTGN